MVNNHITSLPAGMLQCMIISERYCGVRQLQDNSAYKRVNIAVGEMSVSLHQKVQRFNYWNWTARPTRCVCPLVACFFKYKIQLFTMWTRTGLQQTVVTVCTVTLSLTNHTSSRSQLHHCIHESRYISIFFSLIWNLHCYCCLIYSLQK